MDLQRDAAAYLERLAVVCEPTSYLCVIRTSFSRCAIKQITFSSALIYAEYLNQVISCVSALLFSTKVASQANRRCASALESTLQRAALLGVRPKPLKITRRHSGQSAAGS